MIEIRWVNYRGQPRPGAIHVTDNLWQSLQYRQKVSIPHRIGMWKTPEPYWTQWRDVPSSVEITPVDINEAFEAMRNQANSQTPDPE